MNILLLFFRNFGYGFKNCNIFKKFKFIDKYKKNYSKTEPINT